MRSSSVAGPLGPVTSHLRMVSAPLPGARPHSFAISAADRLLPIASPRSSRSCFSSGPVTETDPSKKSNTQRTQQPRRYAENCLILHERPGTQVTLGTDTWVTLKSGGVDAVESRRGGAEAEKPPGVPGRRVFFEGTACPACGSLSTVTTNRNFLEDRNESFYFKLPRRRVDGY